jgi:hypothetical protein
MFVLVHVIIALLSMAHATYLYKKPTRDRLRTSYVLVAMTMTSGFYFAVSAPKHIAEPAPCISWPPTAPPTKKGSPAHRQPACCPVRGFNPIPNIV